MDIKILKLMSIIEDYYCEQEHESKELDKMFKDSNRRELQHGK